MIKAMMVTERTKPVGPTLFMLDEVDLLGFMSSLLEARDRGRKFGISLALLYQSVGQLKDHFGESQFGAWFDSAALVSYAVVKSEDGAKMISNNVGDLTVPVVNKSETKGWRDFAWSKGSQRGRVNVSTNLQKRPLILPHEVREMRADEQIIFCAGRPPLRCGRAIMFRRPEMMAVLGKSRVREGAAPMAKGVAAEACNAGYTFLSPANAANANLAIDERMGKFGGAEVDRGARFATARTTAATVFGREQLGSLDISLDDPSDTEDRAAEELVDGTFSILEGFALQQAATARLDAEAAQSASQHLSRSEPILV